MRSIIGVTGPIASGKGVIAERLKPKGYVLMSLSDEVRKEAQNRGLRIEREILQNVGDSLRTEFGYEVLAQRIAVHLDNMRQKGEAEKVIIDGLRNPSEIKWLREHYDMHVLGVTADSDIRFGRLLQRALPSDPITREDFDKVEQRDRGIGQAGHGNQVEACLDLADVVIENNRSLEDLDKKLREIFIKFGIEDTPKS